MSVKRLLRPFGICLLVALLGACQHTSEKLVMSSKPALELRAMQSRAFDTTDQQKMMRAIIATLQDLGYKIDKVEPAAGSISATKLSRLRLTASIYPRGATQLVVRSNALFKMVEQYTDNQVDDPEFYQKFFFEPLSKAIFLTALQVEDSDEVVTQGVAPGIRSVNPGTENNP